MSPGHDLTLSAPADFPEPGSPSPSQPTPRTLPALLDRQFSVVGTQEASGHRTKQRESGKRRRCYHKDNSFPRPFRKIKNNLELSLKFLNSKP